MAGDKQAAPWPVPKFQFTVSIPDVGDGSFQEVSGLDTEVDIIEYRTGDRAEFTPLKMPGLKKVSDITLKKGMFKGDSALYDYFAQVNGNLIERKAVTISLLDMDNSSVLFTWSLTNAFPMKISGTDMNASNSEVAVEELVLAHEGLKMEAK